MTALTTHQRLIYLLWRNGVSIPEIAWRLGMTDTSARSQIGAAKLKLAIDHDAPRVACPWPPGCVFA